LFENLLFFTSIAVNFLFLKQPVTLIFDIGKTAKKALLFDTDFHVLEEAVEHFTEIPDEDGFPSEDLTAVSDWVIEKLKFFLFHPAYRVTATNFSAYGASLVHLDKANAQLASFYNYLKSFPEECKTVFFEQYNPDGNLPAMTASPWLGMLNSGLQLFWLKKVKAEKFYKISTVLHFPQYFPFLITGKKFTDITSIGCHTMLWDYAKNKYHDWVAKEKFTSLFPEVMPSSHSFEATVFGKNVQCGIGVHDSSAALMPYLVSMSEPFLLLSTGTWNIAFNPFNNTPLTSEELKKDCLCYLTFEGKPVKASRIFLGHEHELQVKAIANHFSLPEENVTRIKFDQNLYDRIVAAADAEKTIYPLGMEGSGPIPEKPSRKTSWQKFTSVEEAYHCMVLQLVKWQIISLNLIDAHRAISQLIVVGGFTKNQLFLEILKAEAKHLKILLSDHPRAAALGAAWLVCGPKAYSGKKDRLQVSAF
jgi:sugar (pentulose or hexulose) kinase